MGLFNLFRYDLIRRSKDVFFIGYNIIFPIVMILLLGYLSSEGYGREFTGYHYYTVVMLPFCVAMAIITAAYAGKDDAYRKTAVRFLFSPVSKVELVLAKLLSCTVVISACNLIVLLFAMFVLRLPIKEELLPLTLLLASEAFLICAIGLFIGLGMKNFLLIKNILNLPICVAAILAGVFYPVGTLNTKVELLLRLSPLTWINRSIFLYIYDGYSALLWRISMAAVVLGVIFTILAVVLFKKEEYIHGDLPGYDK